MSFITIITAYITSSSIFASTPVQFALTALGLSGATAAAQALALILILITVMPITALLGYQLLKKQPKIKIKKPSKPSKPKKIDNSHIKPAPNSKSLPKPNLSLKTQWPDCWKILLFYDKNSIADQSSKITSVDSLVKSNDKQREDNHDWVQLAFPIRTISMFQNTDMVVTDDNINEIRTYLQTTNTSTGKMQFDHSIEAILNHWGLSYDASNQNIAIKNNDVFQTYIMTSGDHNQLRLSRFLQSVYEFHPQGAPICKNLLTTIESHKDYKKINNKTKQVWGSIKAKQLANTQKSGAKSKKNKKPSK